MTKANELRRLCVGASSSSMNSHEIASGAQKKIHICRRLISGITSGFELEMSLNRSYLYARPQPARSTYRGGQSVATGFFNFSLL